MSIRLRTLFMVMMIAALTFGFFHHAFHPSDGHNFERLHIFLFNLCTGGAIILFYTEDKKAASPKVLLFIFLSLTYAILAFLEIYLPALLISLALAVIVESVRIKRFAILPLDFFRKSVPTYEKFNQASLLCLSIGLLISATVILARQFLDIHLPAKLTLNTFFLGFSFPVSLITFSVIFRLMADNPKPAVRRLKEFGFWAVNLGVIIFFIFILVENLVFQLFVTTVLLCTVCMIFVLYVKDGIHAQQKNFLSSGMAFLLYTAATGIAYIILEFFPTYYTPGNAKFLLKLHSFASLYGWNLSGMAIICRYRDFPLRLHSKWIVGFHWLTMIIFAPVGYYVPQFAWVAVLCYTVMLWIIFFNRGTDPMIKKATGNTPSRA